MTVPQRFGTVSCHLGLDRERLVVGAWIFEIFETPSADRGTVSFSPTMARPELKFGSGVVHTKNDTTTKLQRL
jgi:hypothetical protein